MSLTACLKKAGDALRAEDKAAILAAAAKHRKAGMTADEAGRKAVDEQIAKVQAMLEAPAEVAAPAPEPAAPAVEQPEAETDAIDQRIAEAELAGVELSDDDKDKIRAALTKAEELNRKAGRISGLASDPMRKGNAFPMGVGFMRMTKRAEQRIDASVKRAGEAVEVFKRAEQAERYAEALLAGNGTDADKIRKEEVRTETRRVLLDKLLNWKKGDKIGAYTIERVSNDAEGYPSSYTISGDGIIKGVSDKVQVAREFFDGDKEALRAMVDEIRGPTAAAPAEAEKPTPADKPSSKTPLVDAHLELFKGVRAGTATPDDFKAMYRRFRDEKAAVVAELNTSTKDQLLQDISGYVRPGTTKGDLVEMIYNGMLSRFALGKDYGPRWMTMGEEKAYEKATRDALDALVEGQTAESLAEYAAAAKAEFDAEVAKRTALMESVKDPKTLQDFRNYMRLKTSEGMDYQEARLTLTPEQRATMDELAATETRSRRTSAKEEQRTQVRVAGQMVDGGIIATKHTKKGHDLYVVRLSERVSTEDYKTLLEGAKRIGGYYSSYRGGGAIPGFQFTERSQAEAFVKLAGGDNTAAQEAAKDRRNAYEDDRSQSAAERLVEMAEKMEEDADESLGRDRKANTERRARFAAAAEAGARNLQAMAKTMRNVAQALTAGKAKFLDRIRTRTQIELLQTYVANAKGDQLRAKYPTYAEQEKRRGEPPDVETADYAEFPSYTAYRSDLASLGRQLLEVDGTKKLGERLMKVADDVSDAFTAWAKEPGNLFRLSTFSVRSGEDVKTAIFKDRETAERAIKRSGLSGKAIVFPEKRGVNRVIMSPSEAIAKGIWTGDGDKRITLSDEFGAELVEGIGRVAKRQAKDRMNARAAATPWQFERAYERRKQLQRMGLETPAEFRSALREFISLREQAIEADRVKMLERAMVGKAKDGLDFFPTPESVADEMIAAADIKPDMAVLEPSAGMGHIADRIRAAGAEPDVIEMANDRRELLQEKGYHLQPYYDFLQMEPRKFFTYGDVFRAPDGKEGTLRGLGGMGSQRVRLEDEAGNAIGYYQRDEVEGVRLRGTQSGYDRIIMNPPFSNGRDIEHVRHAYTLLKPGGRIVAIMGESAFTNQNKKATEFREWLDSVGGTEEKLPAGTFNDPSLPVNTGANARMVVIDRSESDTPFSRASTGRGIPESDARNLASILRAALPKAPPIIIHDSVDKAPQSLRDAIYAEGAERDVEAAYHEGEIHVFPGHIESAERFNFVVGHHEMRHYGIRGILGQQYKQVLTGIAMRNPTLRAAARAKQDAGLAKDLATGVDEALADMPVEEIAALSGIDRLVSRIRQWLRETAAKLREHKLFALADAIDPKEWTDKDVAHFVWKVEDFARRGGSPMSTGGTMFSGPAQTDTEAFRKWESRLGSRGVAGLVKAVSDKAIKDRLKGHAEALADFLKRQPGATQAGRFGNIPLSVVSHVLGVADNKEVRRAVVAAIPVDVVDLLASKQLSAENLLSDKAMLKDVLAVDGSSDVSLAVDEAAARSLLRAITDAAAEIAGLAGWAFKDGAALGASQSNSVLGAHRRIVTDSPAFSKWFGDSKVVDENGEPLVVYHGTFSDFSKFSDRRLGENTDDNASSQAYAQTSRVGFWFNTKPMGSSSAGYTVDMPAYLSIQNPKTEMSLDWLAQGLESTKGRTYRRQLIADGYDGIVLQDEEFGGESWIAFRPEQIKSATGNRGTFDPADPDIRFSRAAVPDWIAAGNPALQTAAGKISTYAPAKPITQKVREMAAGWKQKLVQGVFDAYAPLKDLSMDAYIAARMTKAADGAFEGMLMYGKPVMQADGGITGDLDGKGFLGMMRELNGEHDRFLMWVAGNRSQRLLNEWTVTMPDGSERIAQGQAAADALVLQNPGAKAKATPRENLFAPAEVAEMVKLNQGAMADGSSRTIAFKRALDQFNAYSKSVLDVAEKSGLIDGESRKVWEHDFYVPFYRVNDEAEISGPGKIKGLVRQKAFERLKGGKEPLGDLMDNTLRNWSHLLSASLSNVAASKSLLAAEGAGIAIEAKEADAKEIAKATGKKGHAVYFMDQGVQRWFVVEDESVLAAVSALEAPALSGLPFQLMSKFKKYLTIGVTIAPAFKVRNLIRDTLAAPAANQMDYNIAKNLAQGWKGTDTKTDAYAQMLFSGGLMKFGTYLEGDRAENVNRLIAQGVDRKTILDSPNKVRAALGLLWDSWQDFGDRMENVNRTALYQQLLDMGVSPREAAFQARDMMDFSLQGAWAGMRTLNAVVPFLNARAQGLYKLGRAAKEDPRRMGYMVGAVSLASIALLLAYQDDDDWKAREDWDRDGFWWIKIGETAYRIPKPFELGAMGTIAERSVELLIDDEMTGARFAERMKQMVTGTFAINPVPQMFKPMLDLYANKDSFTGRQIETLGMERLSKPERYGPNTSAMARALGAAGDYTGISPVQVDHMVRAYFGWLGVQAATAVDVITSPLDSSIKPASKLEDWSGGFVKDLPAAPSRYLEQFYEQAKKTSEAMADLKRARESGDLEKAAEIMEDRASDIAKYRLYQRAERQIGELNKRIRVIRYSTKIDSEDKRTRLDELVAQRNSLAKLVSARAQSQP